MNDLWLSRPSREALDRSTVGVAGRVVVVLLSVAFWGAVLNYAHIL